MHNEKWTISLWAKDVETIAYKTGSYILAAMHDLPEKKVSQA